jgi:hypothetical protein
LVIPLPEGEWDKPLSGHVVYAQGSSIDLTDGTLGNYHRAAKAVAGLKNRKANIVLNDALGLFGSIGPKVSYYPNTLHESVNSFRQYFDDIDTSLDQQEGLNEELKAWFKGQVGK